MKRNHQLNKQLALSFVLQKTAIISFLTNKKTSSYKENKQPIYYEADIFQFS